MSTSTQPEIESSIQLALEAAAAANDAASEIETLSSDTQAAAARLDKFAQVMKPVMMGVVAGAVLAILLGGLVYFRTLSEMRVATATHMEALALFSTSVDELKTQVGSLETLGETLTTLQTDQGAAFTALEAKVETALIAATTEAEADAEEDDAASPLDQQMLRSLSDTVEQNHQTTRDTLTQGLSDLQLALSRMLADRPIATATPKATPKPVASAKPRPAPRPTAKTRPAANPYKYP
jgi:hypothetical protein